MEKKSFLEELAAYRVKVERDGKEIVNIPGILCLPGLLIAPKMGIIGMIAAPLLGCSVHLESGDGKEVNVAEAARKAAESAVETAKTAAQVIREEMDKAWESVSADDPEETDEEEPKSEEAPEADPEEPANGEEPAQEPPVVQARPDDTEEK